MSKVVVDSSVALKWVLIEVHSDLARSLLGQWTQSHTDLLAPDLFAYEIANALYRHTLTGSPLLPMADARAGLTDLLTMGVQFVPITGPDLSIRAMELAERFKRTATYDPHYLALAEREGCEFWTADERLWNSVKADLPWVRWLGEHAPTP